MATEEKAEDKKDLKKEIEKTARLFDVAKPGKSAPNTTSRPIIVGHAPMIKRDPMMREDPDPVEKAPGQVEENAVVVKSHEKKISPLSAPDEPATGNAKDVDTAQVDIPETADAEASLNLNDAPASGEKEAPRSDEKTSNTDSENAPDSAPDTKNDVPAETPPPQETKTEETIAAPPEDPNNKAAVDSLVNEVSAKQADKKEKQDLEARTAEIEEIIEKKEYFVPIGQVSRRRSNQLVVITLMLILVFATVGLNLAVDAGVIDIGLNPLTDIL
jgi:hypothetical protein